MSKFSEEIKLIEQSDLFDRNWYCEQYPDLKALGVDPIQHYLRVGAKLQRDPSPNFSTAYYLECNPDVAESDLNPLLHYLRVGKIEGRLPVPFSIAGGVADNELGASISQPKPVNVHETLAVVTPRSIGIDPISGREYAAEIGVINFSDISEGWVPFEEHAQAETSPRTIAFYLPQFHPLPENDAWWGKGFTEWTNVGKAKPLFEGHHQPHCPIHFGYYDLRLPEVMEEQARVARNYGINGFAYYFYWFAGKLLMEKPLEAMLGNPNVDMPFCFLWANENWTRRWDGMEHDILIGQNHSLDDSRALLQYVRKFFDDPRYINVDGKPLFVVYRPGIIPDLYETLEMWRSEARAMGFPGLYIVSAQGFDHRDPGDYGFDAALQFPPHNMGPADAINSVRGLDPNFEGQIFDYDQTVANAVTRVPEDYKVFPTAMLSWDNTARRGTRSHVFTNFSVTRYAQWLSSNAERVSKDDRLSADEKLIFVNAWNEWAEGAHLEPDQKHGFGYLEASRRVLQNYTDEAAPYLAPALPAQRADMAVILHLHFADLAGGMAEEIRNLGKGVVDIYATATSVASAKALQAECPEAHIELVDNRGRDIRPFLYMLGRVSRLGYTAICKIHGKKSLHRKDGAALRKASFRALLSGSAMSRFRLEPQLGLLVPKGSLLSHYGNYMTNNELLCHEIARELELQFELSKFSAGSMFWFRPEALEPLLKIGQHTFDVERGLVDGTRAHAIERLFCLVCESRGFVVGETN